MCSYLCLQIDGGFRTTDTSFLCTFNTGEGQRDSRSDARPEITGHRPLTGDLKVLSTIQDLKPSEEFTDENYSLKPVSTFPLGQRDIRSSR